MPREVAAIYGEGYVIFCIEAQIKLEAAGARAEGFPILFVDGFIADWAGDQKKCSSLRKRFAELRSLMESGI